MEVFFQIRKRELASPWILDDSKEYKTITIMKRLISLMMLLTVWMVETGAQNYRQENDILYTQKTDAYSQERLKLDVYYPEEKNGCPVVVWFHGGGLEGGGKEIPRRLKTKVMWW